MQAIFTGYKSPPPPGFQNFIFLNFSVHTTLSVPKHHISIKKLCTLRRSTKPESDFRFVQFFLYTLYSMSVLNCSYLGRYKLFALIYLLISTELLKVPRTTVCLYARHLDSSQINSHNIVHSIVRIKMLI